MKKAIVTTLILAIATIGSSTCEAQILKGFGKKLEKKIEERIERKADQQVDKALDNAEKNADEQFNKSASPSKSSPSKSTPQFEDVPVRTDQSMTMMGDDCHGFSWFKKGAVLEYEVFDDKGKLEAETRTEIRDMRNEGTATIAEVDASVTTAELDDMTYQMRYICDDNKIYMDIGSMMKAMMESNPELQQSKEAQDALANTEIDFEGGFASFPKTMYPGMKLEDLSFSFKTNAGAGEMSFNTVVSDRQVVAKEKITTKGGTFDCLKIRSVSHTTINVMGFNQNMPASTEYLWIAPEVGMIKQETHTGKKIGSSMQLKAYKM